MRRPLLRGFGVIGSRGDACRGTGTSTSRIRNQGKETMEGQESSMSLASGMHCLPLPLPARVLFSSP